MLWFKRGFTTCQLTLKCPPSSAEPKFIVAPVPKITAFTEQVTELKCAVEGFPTPKVEWRRQGNKELPFGRHYIRNNNLLLRNPIKEDEDIYMCHASTPAGSVMGGTEVTVITYGKYCALHPASWPRNSSSNPKKMRFKATFTLHQHKLYVYKVQQGQF